jgi:chromate transporter
VTQAASSTTGQAAATDVQAPARRPPLREFFREFLLIGATSFGGGRAAYFQDALVKRRRWLTDDEFLEAVAVSQVLPGPNIGNLAAYLGQRMWGGRGAVLAVLCLTVPGALSILALGWLYFNGMPASIAEPVGKGVAAAAAGLSAAAVWRLRGGASKPASYVVVGATFVLFGPLGWPIYIVLALMVPISAVIALRWR